jgi:ferredoxin--NADP+ reductase
VAFVIVGSCVSDLECLDVCPVDCIHPQPGAPDFETAEMLYIEPDVCVDCGACADACPVDAAVADYDLKPKDMPFVELNAAFFRSR